MKRRQNARRRIGRCPIAAEVLEARRMLSAVAIRGTPRGDAIDLATGDDGGIVVTVNGRATAYAAGTVSQISVWAGNGDDSVTSAVDVPVRLEGGNGRDRLLVVSSSADNVLVGGNGPDLLSSTGSGSDTLVGGNGSDVLYAIVGAPNVVRGGRGGDELIVRDGVESHDGAKEDLIVAFRFDRAPVELRGGVLYVLGGGQTVIDEAGGRLLVSVDGQTTVYRSRDVDAIAGIGGAGDDLFVNGTRKPSVYYGFGGNDTLIGGSSADVLKGGGGDDLINGGRGDDFATGDGGSDRLDGGPGRDFVLSDALDAAFSDPSFAF